MRAFVVGNGPSLNNTPLDMLIGENTYAVNAIWKIFDKTKWRPQTWVRSETPNFDDIVCDDLIHMAKTDVRIWLPPGYYRFAGRQDVAFGRPVIPYIPCGRTRPEHWHLDLGDYICTYGTSLHVAMQIAVMEGADSIYLVGCDLGEEHFYPNHKFSSSDVALAAHQMAKESCPVPIYNATIGGNLEVYPRVDFFSLFEKK